MGDTSIIPSENPFSSAAPDLKYAIVPRGFLRQVLRRMEDAWNAVDEEYGRTGGGGLDGAIERGEEPEIAKLREIAMDPPPPEPIYDRCTCYEYKWEREVCFYDLKVMGVERLCKCCPYDRRKCLDLAIKSEVEKEIKGVYRNKFRDGFTVGNFKIKDVSIEFK